MVSGDICVVAGGWSAAAVDLKRLPGIVIAANEASLIIPCHLAVSMDRLWTENRWAQLVERGKDAWIRNAALKNVACWPRPDWLKPFENDWRSSKFSEEPGTLNGTNSGFCALNLAFQLEPKRVFLFGFDMNTGPGGQVYWHPPHPWKSPTKTGKYPEWADEMEDAALAFLSRNVNVYNVSATSAIEAFAKITPKQFGEMTR